MAMSVTAELAGLQGKIVRKMHIPRFYRMLEENMENKYGTTYNFAVLSPNILKLYVKRNCDCSAVWMREDAKLCAHSDVFLHFIYMGDKLCVQQLVQTNEQEPELFWRDFRDSRPGLTWILFKNFLEREMSLHIKKAGIR